MNQAYISPTIGILDSGLGGLSVLAEIRRQLPSAKLHYVADSAHCPYGSKPEGFIRQRVAQISDFLLGQGAELLVIACNSATIVAVETLRASYPVPVVGMEPAIKPAAELTRTGVIGVLATEASLAGDKYHRLVSTHACDLHLITRAAPEFVELVEAGQLSGAAVEAAIALHLEPLVTADADVLVLGCTHYPFLRPAIEAYLNCHYQDKQLKVLDTGAAVAAQVLRRLPQPSAKPYASSSSHPPIPTTKAKASPEFHAWSSAEPDPELATLMNQLAQESLSSLKQLPALDEKPKPKLDPSA